jgi:hypothetical protein
MEYFQVKNKENWQKIGLYLSKYREMGSLVKKYKKTQINRIARGREEWIPSLHRNRET